MPAGARPRAGSVTASASSCGGGPVVVADEPERRVAERRPRRRRVHRGQVLGRLEEGVGAAAGRVDPQRRVHRQQRTGVAAALPRAWRSADGHQRVVAADQPVHAAAEVEQQLALEDVQRLLEAVDVAARASRPGGGRPAASSVWTAPCSRPMKRLPREAAGGRAGRRRLVGERPVESRRRDGPRVPPSRVLQPRHVERPAAEHEPDRVDRHVAARCTGGAASSSRT